MSKYTTGEIARLCDVSVRTVQYYDSRKILVPSELSEGGRRLYSEDDLRKLKVICFLRSVDVPINSISQLFEEKKKEVKEQKPKAEKPVEEQPKKEKQEKPTPSLCRKNDWRSCVLPDRARSSGRYRRRCPR